MYSTNARSIYLATTLMIENLIDGYLWSCPCPRLWSLSSHETHHPGPGTPARHVPRY
jgi:hypothetical protein